MIVTINSHDYELPDVSGMRSARYRSEANIENATYAVAHLVNSGLQPRTVLRKVSELYGISQEVIIGEIEAKYGVKREAFGL